ncbi:MAG TPA: DUF5658 family protein [Candidatus Dormibacteraeota bacterium]|nr:DUF5658 family protein [Candidatus Dormibacteraeota bacterium]
MVQSVPAPLQRPGAALGGLLRSPGFAVAWVVYLAGNVADAMTTGQALAHGLRERNPLAAAVYDHAGIGGLWALKSAVLALMLVALVAVPRRIAVVLAVIFAATMAVDVAANLDALAASGL